MPLSRFLGIIYPRVNPATAWECYSLQRHYKIGTFMVVHLVAGSSSIGQPKNTATMIQRMIGRLSTPRNLAPDGGLVACIGRDSAMHTNGNSNTAQATRTSYELYH
jgi:hypothetical protein